MDDTTAESESGTRGWEELGLRDRVLRGDERAWRTLYDRHFAALYRFVYYRSGRDRSRADDAAQECWKVAVKNIGAFDPERAPFDAWLRGIAMNVLRGDARRERTRAELLPREADSSVAEHAAGRREEIAEKDAIVCSMVALPDAYRAVLREKYVEGCAVAEIATRRDISAKAAESLLSRARSAFKSIYKSIT